MKSLFHPSGLSSSFTAIELGEQKCENGYKKKKKTKLFLITGEASVLTFPVYKYIYIPKNTT